ncbi:DUF5131 family protein [Streptomyces scabiei]|uniref:DUF5131 family protein n=1 Tax=Streptomyces scabiei TaxID=1930 RepID=UPI0033FEB417
MTIAWSPYLSRMPTARTKRPTSSPGSSIRISVHAIAAALSTPYFFKPWGEWAPSGLIAIGGTRRGRALVGVPIGELGHRVGLIRLGKKKAGRLLDGQLHDAVLPHSPARANSARSLSPFCGLTP